MSKSSEFNFFCSQYCSVNNQTVEEETAKVSDWSWVKPVRWIGFLALNLDRGFLTTLGLVRPWRVGMIWSVISEINQEKK